MHFTHTSKYIHVHSKQPFLTDNEQQPQIYTQLLIGIVLGTIHKGIYVAAASIRQRQQIKLIPSTTKKYPSYPDFIIAYLDRSVVFELTKHIIWMLFVAACSSHFFVDNQYFP